jgi:hypothetical protein
MRADTPLAGRWLAAIERAEKYEKETDEVDPGEFFVLFFFFSIAGATAQPFANMIQI